MDEIRLDTSILIDKVRLDVLVLIDKVHLNAVTLVVEVVAHCFEIFPLDNS